VPLIEVSISAGRTSEQLRDLVHGLHEAVVATVDARPEHVTVIVREVPRDHWAVGDVTLSEMDARRLPG
jgi:4-oxalocrotonate tautomerase